MRTKGCALAAASSPDQGFRFTASEASWGPEAVVFKGYLFILKEYIKFLIDPAAPNQLEMLPKTKAIKSF